MTKKKKKPSRTTEPGAYQEVVKYLRERRGQNVLITDLMADLNMSRDKVRGAVTLLLHNDLEFLSTYTATPTGGYYTVRIIIDYADKSGNIYDPAGWPVPRSLRQPVRTSKGAEAVKTTYWKGVSD